MFEPKKFLDTLILQLRELGVDMTPINPPQPNSIELLPSSCYKVTCYGHTPRLHNVQQPAYSLVAFVYPDQRALVISGNNDCPYFNAQGLTPAEAILKEHGLTDHLMQPWAVTFE